MIKFSSMDVKKTKADTLVVPVCEDKKIHTDRALAALCKRALAVKEFKAGAKDELILYNPPQLKIERAVFIGLGKADDMTVETLRTFMGCAVKKCTSLDLMQIVVAIPAGKRIKLDETATMEALIESAYLAKMRDNCDRSWHGDD